MPARSSGVAILVDDVEVVEPAAPLLPDDLARRSEELRQRLLQSALYRPAAANGLPLAANNLDHKGAEDDGGHALERSEVRLVPAPGAQKRAKLKQGALTLAQLSAMAKDGGMSKGIAEPVALPPRTEEFLPASSPVPLSRQLHHSGPTKPTCTKSGPSRPPASLQRTDVPPGDFRSSAVPGAPSTHGVSHLRRGLPLLAVSHVADGPPGDFGVATDAKNAAEGTLQDLPDFDIDEDIPLQQSEENHGATKSSKLAACLAVPVRHPDASASPPAVGAPSPANASVAPDLQCDAAPMQPLECSRSPSSGIVGKQLQRQPSACSPSVPCEKLTASGPASSSFSVAASPKAGTSSVSPASGVKRHTHGNIIKSFVNHPAKRPKHDDGALMAGWQSLIERTRKHPEYFNEYTRRFNQEGANWKKATSGTSSRLAVGLDCEMVYANGDQNALARVTVVTFNGMLLDEYVLRSPSEVRDFRTSISGVEAHHLSAENGALALEEVQDKVLALLSPDTIIVGHALHNDLRALRIQHSKLVDTSFLLLVDCGAHNHRPKHKLHSLVSLMKSKVATLSSAVAGRAHDSRQDAEWALQLALYEASIHPRSTGALKLETFPTKIHLTEIAQGTPESELQALFPRGEVGELAFQLQGDSPGEWLGRAFVTFVSQALRDAAFEGLARFVSVRVGPFHEWASRKDVAGMEKDLTQHFSKYGRVRSCKVCHPRPPAGKMALPVAMIDCHPTLARTLLTTKEAHSLPQHRSVFQVRLADEDLRGARAPRRCAVPLPKGYLFAKLQ